MQNELSSILVVDDDEVLLDMLRNSLSDQGYTCLSASDVRSALEMIKEAPFDILLTDIKMPGISGLELTERAKKIRPDMIVIIMTGFIEEFFYENAVEAGAVDFIKKPFTLAELFARIKHVKMQEKLRVMAVTDELTGLSNRRGFFTLAELQLKLANRQKKQLFIMLADLDDLKEINDTFGHQEGDKALKEVSDVFRKVFRESDIIARIGGDEFVVIPIDMIDSGTDAIIERLQKILTVHNAKTERTWKITLSVGIAVYDPEAPQTIDELLAQADRLMYEQKKTK